MQITGYIIAVLPKREGTSQSGKQWASLDFVVQVPGNYPSNVCLNIFGAERIQQLNPQTGEQVTVDFDIDAHEYQGRWFNSLRAWNITRAAAPTATTPTAQTPQQAPQTQDELPF